VSTAAKSAASWTRSLATSADTFTSALALERGFGAARTGSVCSLLTSAAAALALAFAFGVGEAWAMSAAAATTVGSTTGAVLHVRRRFGSGGTGWRSPPVMLKKAAIFARVVRRGSDGTSTAATTDASSTEERAVA
jgi:hypothetical protein